MKILIDAALKDSEFSVVHDFLRFFSVEVEKEATDFYKWALDLGETAFKGQLGDDRNTGPSAGAGGVAVHVKIAQ